MARSIPGSNGDRRKSGLKDISLGGFNVLSCGPDLPPEGNAERLREDASDTKDDFGTKYRKNYSTGQKAIKRISS
jgi:hypothetical protein